MNQLGLIKTDNLRKIVAFLKENKELVQDHFDMETYCDTYDGVHLIKTKTPETIPCNTNMCIIGWTTVMPEFKDQLKNVNDWDDVSSVVMGFSNCIIGEELRESHRISDVECSWFLSESNFKFYSNLWKYLFGTDNENDVDQAIKRLTKIIKFTENNDVESIEKIIYNL